MNQGLTFKLFSVNPNEQTFNFFCSMLISEYSCAVAKAAARAFFLWLLALLGTEVVMGIGVCTMLIGEFSGRLSSCETKISVSMGRKIN